MHPEILEAILGPKSGPDFYFPLLRSWKYRNAVVCVMSDVCLCVPKIYYVYLCRFSENIVQMWVKSLSVRKVYLCRGSFKYQI